jgi:serpin B
MKRTAALALTVALLGNASPLPSPAVANYDGLGFELLARLASSPKSGNVFISPLSIGVALSMAADGAGGQTRAAILRVLGLEGDASTTNAGLIAELAANRDAEVGIANALWLREDLPPKPAYVALLANDYAAQAQALHFGNPSAAEAINAWTKEHTLGLIDHLVDDTRSSDILYLTNALAFVGKWTAPFDESDTARTDFTAADGTKQRVQMMSQTGAFQTGTGDGFQALRMPYGKGGGYAAYILLPDGGDVGPLVHSLTADRFEAIVQSLSTQTLRVELPRFTATYRVSLGAPLAAAGMGVAFSDGADFSNIRNVPPKIAISDVEHATYLRVDEAGTTAAAATSVGMRVLAIQAPQQAFIVNRPFVFAIRDERAGALLFVGAIRTIPHPKE